MVSAKHIRTAGTALLVISALCRPVPSRAQVPDVFGFEQPVQDLGRALQEVAARSGRNLIVSSDLIAGRRAPALIGRYTTEAAMQRLLAGTGLALRLVDGNLVVVAEAGQIAASGSDDGAIVVTGSRIRGAGPVGANLITIDRGDIEQSGYATTQEIAQTIPQNFGGGPNENTGGTTLDPSSGRNTALGSSLNLRGLGASSTLVLLNGDRPPLGGFAGVFSDISLIPAVAIERIEVLADGTSAIYGSDAVAGVVNIIPRLRFEGAETSFRIGTADGDAQDVVASQIVGTAWSSGRAVLAYEFYRRDALPAATRAYVSDDLSAFGGPDLRGGYANPGTILAGGRTFAIPSGQDGRALRPSDLLPGVINRGDSWSLTDILPMQRRHSVFGAVRQDLADWLHVYAQGLFTSRAFSRRARTMSDTARTVPVTNPFYVDPIGTRQPVRVQYDFGRDLGRETREGEVEAYGLTLGLHADRGEWSFELRGNFGEQTERAAILNRVNSARLNAALADPNPATAYNLFGDGPSTNPVTIAAVRGSTLTGNQATVWSVSARAGGPVFTLPAGPARVAIGAEYRQERYRDEPTISDTSALVPQILDAIPLPGPRRIKAVYAEALLPIFGGGFRASRAERLDVSLAIRHEDYSDFGSTTNPRVGATWEPLSGLRLRGTYGTSFRAPSIDNLRQDPGTTLLFAFRIPDPASPSGQSNVLVQRGNDPDLQPEQATTWSLGADLTPAFLPGFQAQATYYEIDYRGRITSPAASLFSFLVNRPTYAGIIQDRPSADAVRAFYASPFFTNPLNIAPETITAIVDARLQNLSTVRQTGLDAELSYGFDLLGGRAELGANAAFIFKIEQALTASAPVRNVVGILGNPVDFRMRGRALWNNTRWSAALFVNYLDSYTNLTNVTPQTVDSWTTIDAQIGYSFPQTGGPLAGLRVALSATNLFDADPPFAAYNLGILINGYDAENASPLGRVVSLQVTKRW